MTDRKYEEWERVNQRIELYIMMLLIVISLIVFGIVLPAITTSII